MDRVDSDKKKNLDVKVWKEYQSVLDSTQENKTELTYIERFQFYERAKKAYGINELFLLTRIFTVLIFFKLSKRS